MSSSVIDVDEYFARIGHTGGRDATLANLHALIVRHTQTIPFENLNPLAHWPVQLAPDALTQKLIRAQRGGYCFEQNLLLKSVLQQLGYHVTALAARVLWNLPESTVLMRSHMLLLVDLEESPHVVDVGFGGLTLTGVLRLETDSAQRTPHESFRFVRQDGEFIMQACVRDTWRSLYRFDLQPQRDVDYEPVNWYLSTHPESRFVNNLVAARSTADGRHALFNRELALHPLHGETQRRTLQNVDELRRVLAEIFLIRVPESVEMEAALTRAFGQ